LEYLLRKMFVVFEGIDGSGKTTLSKLLVEELNKKGHTAVWTKEPFDNQIREVILSKNLDPWSEVFLFLSDRREHVLKVIKPALDKGYIVVCDRYYYSTLAYQGFGKGLNLQKLEKLNKFATEGLEPDIVFILDIDPQKALERINKTRGEKTKFEKLQFLQKVREGFLNLAKEKENILILNAEEELTKLLSTVLLHILVKLNSAH